MRNVSFPIAFSMSRAFGGESSHLADNAMGDMHKQETKLAK